LGDFPITSVEDAALAACALKKVQWWVKLTQSFSSMSKRRKQRGAAPSTGRINADAPDRTQILSLLESSGRPLQRKQIVASLKVESDDSREILRRRLRAMERDGQVIRNRRNAYGVVAKMDLIRGRVQAHRDGFGFVIPDDGGEDLFLSPRRMRSVLHGDIVLASVAGVDDRGRREGSIAEVLERGNETVVGHYVEENGFALVVPDDPRINQDVMIPLADSGGARPGQVVVAGIVKPPTDRKPPVGRVLEILGRSGAPGMATEIAIRNFDLPYEWPKGLEAAADSIGAVVPEAMKQGRKDLRSLPLVTIDGADARDFDDAVYARRQNNGWKLLVAIADVASYVVPDEALDREAKHRATSVYFPNRVIPMLPEALSNGLCSLKPGEDRLCLVCEMSVSEQGKVTRSRFVAGLMKSAARLTYGQVWKYLDGGKLPSHLDQHKVRENLDALHDVYAALRQARRKRGAIDFESTEVRFCFDEQGRVDELVPVKRNDAHMLIEECMILANVEAARFLLKSGLPAPYRVHEPPPDMKLEKLNSFLRGVGLPVPWRDKPSPRDFEDIVEQTRGRADEALIMAVLLRAQSLAVYQTENKGHFGLALDAYAHFTSPIRRYPDLLTHRAIHHLLQRKKKASFKYSLDDMKQLCDRCSERSRRAEEAERDVNSRLKCVYLERHVGDEFSGIVSGVTSFGLFVELDGTGINGLVHVTALPNDYYHFDPVHHSMTGERRGRVFQLADRVKVRVMAVNIDDRKVDFELVK
jgi:ribonuclease R